MATTFPEILDTIPGLTHFWDLEKDCRDSVGSLHGINHGATFKDGKAVFDGKSSIEIPDHDDFSIATKGAVSIVMTVKTDWVGKGNSQYIHFAGKGSASKGHEFVFRHYVKGGTGEAAQRPGRMSFYVFNKDGGLGAGSYYQDSSFPTTERQVVGMSDKVNCSIAVGGLVRDKDPLSGYTIKPTNEGAPFMLGTRDGGSYLVGTIDKVALFTRPTVLTAAELAKINSARGLPDGQPEVTPEPPEVPVVTPPPTGTLPLVSLDGDVTAMEVAVAHNMLAQMLRDAKVL